MNRRALVFGLFVVLLVGWVGAGAVGFEEPTTDLRGTGFGTGEGCDVVGFVHTNSADRVVVEWTRSPEHGLPHTGGAIVRGDGVNGTGAYVDVDAPQWSNVTVRAVYFNHPVTADEKIEVLHRYRVGPACELQETEERL